MTEEDQKRLDEQSKTDIQQNNDSRFGALDKDLVNLIKYYEIKYFRENKPIPFCGLNIYPVAVRDYEEFANCCGCLTLNKNESPDGIRMSHLDYLISKTQIKEEGEGATWSNRIQRLFELIFRIENGLKCKDCGHIIRYDSEEFKNYMIEMRKYIETATKDPEAAQNLEPPKLICPKCGKEEFIEMIKIVQDPETKKYSFLIDGHKIDRNDFIKLRQIVLFQNYIDYADESGIDPEVKKDHDARMRMERMKNDVHATIEEKVACLSISTCYKVEEIYDMSIRTFTLLLSRVDDKLNYQITKQAVMSGFVSLPKGKRIDHWIYKPYKDMYGDSYKSMDEVDEQVSHL